MRRWEGTVSAKPQVRGCSVYLWNGQEARGAGVERAEERVTEDDLAGIRPVFNVHLIIKKQQESTPVFYLGIFKQVQP